MSKNGNVIERNLEWKFIDVNRYNNRPKIVLDKTTLNFYKGICAREPPVKLRDNKKKVLRLDRWVGTWKKKRVHKQWGNNFNWQIRNTQNGRTTIEGRDFLFLFWKGKRTREKLSSNFLFIDLDDIPINQEIAKLMKSFAISLFSIEITSF